MTTSSGSFDVTRSPVLSDHAGSMSGDVTVATVTWEDLADRLPQLPTVSFSGHAREHERKLREPRREWANQVAHLFNATATLTPAQTDLVLQALRWTDARTPSLAEALAARPELSEQAMVRLVGMSRFGLATAMKILYARADLTDRVVREALKLRLQSSAISVLAENPSVAARWLPLMTGSRFLMVRLAVAARVDTPNGTLRKMAAQDPDEEVRAVLAERTDLPEPTLRSLTDDPSPLVRAALANNPVVPEETRVLLALGLPPGVQVS
jgi:hypothetical protein